MRVYRRIRCLVRQPPSQMSLQTQTEPPLGNGDTADENERDKPDNMAYIGAYEAFEKSRKRSTDSQNGSADKAYHDR